MQGNFFLNLQMSLVCMLPGNCSSQ